MVFYPLHYLYLILYPNRRNLINITRAPISYPYATAPKRNTMRLTSIQPRSVQRYNFPVFFCTVAKIPSAYLGWHKYRHVILWNWRKKNEELFYSLWFPLDSYGPLIRPYSVPFISVSQQWTQHPTWLDTENINILACCWRN